MSGDFGNVHLSQNNCLFCKKLRVNTFMVRKMKNDRKMSHYNYFSNRLAIMQQCTATNFFIVSK
jgi:hypothetical protein